MAILKKPLKRPPANTSDLAGNSYTTYYKDDNRTIDYVIVTKKDETKIIKSGEK